MLSLTPEAYRNIEKGESDPSFTTVLQITKILEMDRLRINEWSSTCKILEV